MITNRRVSFAADFILLYTRYRGYKRCGLPVMMWAWRAGRNYCPSFASHSSRSLGTGGAEIGLGRDCRLSAAQLVAGTVLYVIVEEKLVRHCFLSVNTKPGNLRRLTGKRGLAHGWNGHRQPSSCCWGL